VTPAGIITDVRRLLQDTMAPFRYSDTELLGYVNQVLGRMAVLRPDLFGEIDTVATTADSAVQGLPADAVRLIDVFQVDGGGAIREVDRETMSRINPGWMSEASGTPVNYMRHVKNPTKFFLYPPPSAGVSLVVEYAKTPPTYASGDTITQPPAAFFGAIVDGVVWLAESVDNEHISTGRAKMFYDSFANLLNGSYQSRVTTDTKAAGLGKRTLTRTGVQAGEVI
jgi:hypothetical protein